MIGRWVLALALVAASGAAAQSPDTSARPMLRGGDVVAPVVVDKTPEAISARGGLLQSLRPIFRSRKVEKAGRDQQTLRAKGAVCGDVAIQGDVVGRVTGKLRGCGVENAVRVRSVAGVALSTGAVMDCGTANALKKWMESSAKPALSGNRGGLKSIRVAAHYACRSRNNQRGAKISEHGKGRAIDISGFRFNDGTEVSVLKGWGARATGKAMRQMHRGACGTFGTVLGPDANKYHRDHFHFDTARYRSGSYCR